MKTFQQFLEQTERGRVQIWSPQDYERHRRVSTTRARSVASKMQQKSQDELSAHQSNIRTLLSKRSDTQIRGSH